MDEKNPPRVRLDTSLEALLERAPLDDACALATLVATAGSTYRKSGARMLILKDGDYVGLLSGGCLESDLGVHAREVIDSGVPRAVEYDMRGPDDVLFGIGSGCEGAMRILLEPAGPGSLAAAALASAAATTRLGEPAALVVVHESRNLALGTYFASTLLPRELTLASHQALTERSSNNLTADVDGDKTRALIQFLAPPPHLLVCGAGPDAEPVVAAAIALGWRVSVVDHRPAYAVARRFPGAEMRRADARDLRSVVAIEHCHAAVVMSHHLPSDVLYLRELAKTSAPVYVGLLGPAARRQRALRELEPEVAAELRTRIHGPVGFDIGAVTPEGIALAIVSEIHAYLAGRMESVVSRDLPAAHPSAVARCS